MRDKRMRCLDPVTGLPMFPITAAHVIGRQERELIAS